MGIKELWTILEPFSERKSLFELEGKTVAIDLSGWICDSQNVVEYEVQPNMFLRNLYFRTSCLLMIGVVPVFVLEGSAPSLKLNTINKRSEIQFKGSKPRNPTQTRTNDKTSRSRFNPVLHQCEKLLNSLGLKCVKGPGEAEAFCAYLNENDFVDGIISQDSDCFGYGAIKVYRNFCVSQQSAQGGTVDVYDLKKIQQAKCIGRNHMISLALLCGCDYCPEGVGGVGKDSALKLIETYDDETILNRIRSWRTNHQLFDSLEIEVSNKNICLQCGHKGNLRTHTKSGCVSCATFSGCNNSDFRDKRLIIKNELTIRKKALTNAEFPDENVIKEFLTKPAEKPKLNLSWTMPSMHDFFKIMKSVLDWEEIYCFKKFLPLLTRWQLKRNCPTHGQEPHLLKPLTINKKRTLKGIACFEIIWKDEAGVYQNLIPKDQIYQYCELNSEETLWSTVEPEDLVKRAYPDLIINYEESIMARKKVKKSKKVIAGPTKNTEARNSQKTSPKQLCTNKEKNLGIKQFFKVQKKVQSRALLSSNSTQHLKHNLIGLLTHVDSDSESELNLSDIVNNISSRQGVLAKPIVFESKYVEDISQNTVRDDLNQSYFFSNNAEIDQFEKTFDKLIGVSTENVSKSADALNLSNEIDKSPPNSPEFEYIPLIERIKNKQKQIQF